MAVSVSAQEFGVKAGYNISSSTYGMAANHNDNYSMDNFYNSVSSGF